MKKLISLFLLLALCGCKINQNVMFKTDSSYPYTTAQTLGNIEYKIAPNDLLGISVYTNDGFKLIDLTVNSGSVTDVSSQNAGNITSNQYLVDIVGYVKLPIIGRIKIQNYTKNESEKMLETQYATYYNKPFVTVRILNRRVLVFPGEGGAGRVVTLTNENTTLIEALALAGGISTNGKAAHIKLIRGDNRNPQVELIDLSTVDGMKKSNLLLEANDIIYVEPTRRLSQGVLTEIAPIVGIVTSLASVVIAYTVIKNNKF
jgi:polysaccharide export outer membrane protein